MGHIKGLDGLRAIAVSLVILSHLTVTAAIAKMGPLGEGLSMIMTPVAGVEIFLVLSGFLITTLLIREHRKNGRISLVNFYIRRTLRIFPLYFLFVFAVLALSFVGNTGLKNGSIPYLFFMSYNFVPRADYTAMLGHTWSIGVEEHFYLIWPTLFAIFYASRRFGLIVGAVLVFLLFWFLSIYLPPYFPNHFVSRWTFTAGWPIVLGCILSMLIHSGIAGSFTKRAVSGKIAIIFGLLFFFHTLATPLPAWISPQVRGLGTVLIIGWLYFNQNSALTTVLEFGPIAYIGRISYGLYMWQGFCISSGPSRFTGQTWPPDQMTGLVLLAIIAPLSWHGMEKPILALKSKLQRPIKQGRISTEHSHNVDFSEPAEPRS